MILALSEILFICDFFINFFIIPDDMKQPRLKKTVKSYLTGFFIIDFAATIISSLLYLVPTNNAKFWRDHLKLLRIFRIEYIRFAYKGII